MGKEHLAAVMEVVVEILEIVIDVVMVEGDALGTEEEIGIVTEDTEVVVDVSMEAIAGNKNNFSRLYFLFSLVLRILTYVVCLIFHLHHQIRTKMNNHQLYK